MPETNRSIDRAKQALFDETRKTLVIYEHMGTREQIESQRKLLEKVAEDLIFNDIL